MTIMMDRDRLFSSLAENRAREMVAHIGFLRKLRQLYEGGVTPDTAGGGERRQRAGNQPDAPARLDRGTGCAAGHPRRHRV